jgi:hypothetical protein
MGDLGRRAKGAVCSPTTLWKYYTGVSSVARTSYYALGKHGSSTWGVDNGRKWCHFLRLS